MPPPGAGTPYAVAADRHRVPERFAYLLVARPLPKEPAFRLGLVPVGTVSSGGSTAGALDACEAMKADERLTQPTPTNEACHAR